MRREILTTCTRDCPNACGLTAVMDDGRLIQLKGSPEHPYSRGRACAKTATFVKRLYSPERITHPLLRENGRWRRASWDEALDLVAERLQAIKAESGPEAILFYQGFGERTGLKILNTRFFNLFGGVSTLYGTLCGGAGMASQNLDFGLRVSHEPTDHLHSRSVVLWGRNPAATQIGLVPILRQVRDQGGTVVLVDPLATESVRLADLHIQPRPGSDAYLAMAAAKLVLQAGREAKGFLAAATIHFDRFQAILDAVSLEECAGRCDVPLSQIERLADLYMTARPTATLLGWGLHRWVQPDLAIRCIDALGAISGNLGVPGGGVSQGFEEFGPYDPAGWGEDLCPPRRKLLMPRIGQELLDADPPVRMIMVVAGNPVNMAPNSAKVAEAFERTECVVYVGHFLDDTADRAHVFLPSTTFLEDDDVMAGYGHNWVGPVNKAVEPQGEARTNYWMFCQLARRLGFADRFVREPEDWLKDLLKPMYDQGSCLEEIKRAPVRRHEPEVPYADGRFPTPSGKFQFLELFDPAPRPAAETEGYPYFLMSTSPAAWLCSELTLAEHPERPEARLHPAEADRLGLADGERAWLVSPVGRVEVTVRLDPAARPDAIACPRGGWIKAGHGVNRLTLDLVSRVGNGAPYYETRVRLEKAAP